MRTKVKPTPPSSLCGFLKDLRPAWFLLTLWVWICIQINSTSWLKNSKVWWQKRIYKSDVMNSQHHHLHHQLMSRIMQWSNMGWRPVWFCFGYPQLKWLTGNILNTYTHLCSAVQARHSSLPLTSTDTQYESFPECAERATVQHNTQNTFLSFPSN